MGKLNIMSYKVMHRFKLENIAGGRGVLRFQIMPYQKMKTGDLLFFKEIAVFIIEASKSDYGHLTGYGVEISVDRAEALLKSKTQKDRTK